MVSDLATTFGFLAMIAMKLLSTNLYCTLPPPSNNNQAILRQVIRLVITDRS